MSTTTSRKSNVKLDFLRKIEVEHQRRWKENRYFESDAPAGASNDLDPGKYFVTFPYPYMNGRLHLGHGFSLSKCEFALGYQRLRGKRCLFPFGLHCTGMPIRACADKLRNELETYGFPPDFENPTTSGKEKPEGTPQWSIMRSFGLTDENIRKFVDSAHWLFYFPPLAIEDVLALGAKVDVRRSFITTDANPYYDSFVRWQFLRLRERGCIEFGKRYTIYCVKDDQPCMDHDRLSGEGVQPLEYTAVKLHLLEDKSGLSKSLDTTAASKVYLVAATMRPETLYGMTNCYVHPDHEYVVYPGCGENEYLVSSESSARNMCFQGMTRTANQYDVVSRVRGAALLGSRVEAPLSHYTSVYVLPMMSILPSKGTGVVISVPSDSPDDFAALNDLKEKPALRQKYLLEEHMVMAFSEIPIIDTPPFGSLPAPALCREMKICSQNDAIPLKEAKERLYKASFYQGVMLVGTYCGLPVQEAKRLVREALVADGLAFTYMEPESTVVSRSGDICVVALCDQWYLSYGDPQWKNAVRTALDRLETFGLEVRNNFLATLEWLHEHACSRQYGLGTRLPWDDTYLIESLSDSTIYMAYYTVAHILQAGILDGSGPSPYGVTPEQMTPEVWDYVFLDDTLPPRHTTIPTSTLDLMRREFRYWYPLDLRVSGKDLIPNHLTYCLYNHVAIWPNHPEKWPRAFRANGYLMLNSQKMSKSTGNFLTLFDSIQKFGADATRLGLADSGDTIEDANFVEKTVDASVLRLYNLAEWSKEMLQCDSLRTGPCDRFHDCVFSSEIDKAIVTTGHNYDSMLFREALKSGFFELQVARDWYKELSLQSPHKDLVHRYIEVQCILLAPICPHLADHVYGLLGKGSVMNAVWPEVTSYDDSLLECSKYLSGSVASFRARLKFLKDSAVKKNSTFAPLTATIYVTERYTDWQEDVLSMLSQLYIAEGNCFPDNKEILAGVQTRASVSSQKIQKVMTFMNHFKEKATNEGIAALSSKTPFNEEAIFTENLAYIAKTLEVDTVKVEPSSSAATTSEEALPLRPTVMFH